MSKAKDKALIEVIRHQQMSIDQLISQLCLANAILTAATTKGDGKEPQKSCGVN